MQESLLKCKTILYSSSASYLKKRRRPKYILFWCYTIFCKLPLPLYIYVYKKVCIDVWVCCVAHMNFKKDTHI